MAITPIEHMKQFAGGSEVELPGFINDEPITVILRRPSLMLLVKEGEIPNPLLGATASLFKNGYLSEMDEGESFKNLCEIMLKVAEASLVSPTFEELEAAGVTLTDQQLLYIYNFAQFGVNALSRFRQEQKPVHAEPSGKRVPKTAK